VVGSRRSRSSRRLNASNASRNSGVSSAKTISAKPGEEVIIKKELTPVEKAKEKYDAAVKKDKDSKKHEMKVKVPADKDDGDKGKTEEPAKTDEPVVDEHDDVK